MVEKNLPVGTDSTRKVAVSNQNFLFAEVMLNFLLLTNEMKAAEILSFYGRYGLVILAYSYGRNKQEILSLLRSCKIFCCLQMK